MKDSKKDQKSEEEVRGIIRIDESQIQTHVDGIVRKSVERH